MKWLSLVSFLALVLAVQSAPTGDGKKQLKKSRSQKERSLAELSFSSSPSPPIVVESSAPVPQLGKMRLSGATRQHLDTAARHLTVESEEPLVQVHRAKRKKVITIPDSSSGEDFIPLPPRKEVVGKKAKTATTKKQKKTAITSPEASHHSSSQSVVDRKGKSIVGQQRLPSMQPEVKKQELYEPLSPSKYNAKQDWDAFIENNNWGTPQMTTKNWNLNDLYSDPVSRIPAHSNFPQVSTTS